MHSKIFSKEKALLVSIALMFLAVAAFVGGIMPARTAYAASSSVKIRYNNKTRINKSKKMTVKYGKKTVSKSGYKALVINGSYMVPYTDVFKQGVKAVCKYSSKTKTLTISKNEVTIQMTVGKKTAYVNGKKKTLSAPPLSVRYVSKKKTRILVPVSFVAKQLHLSYQKSGTTINIADPLVLSCDGKTTYYTGAQGSIFYNHKKYGLKEMPVIKVNGAMYMPAREVLDGILNLQYSYQESNGKLTVSNEDTHMEMVLHLDSNSAEVNNGAVTLSAPVRMIKNVSTNKDVLCVPVSDVARQLGYTRSWNKSNQYYIIQSKLFFDWSKDLGSVKTDNGTLGNAGSGSADTGNTGTDSPASSGGNAGNANPDDGKEENNGTANPEPNYIHAGKASYDAGNGTGAIILSITGSNMSMDQMTVTRSGKVITVTIPQSKYILDKNQFSNFGEIVQKMEITYTEDNTVAVTLTCEDTTDYSYIVQNNVLEISLLGSAVTNYSLTVPKPAGVTIAQVTNQDLYASKKFRIDIKGNHVDFFKKNPIIINNNSVRSVAVTKSGSNTRITVATSSLRGYKIYEKGNNIVVSIAAPRTIYKSIVVLDAGHGGHDGGASNKGTKEKDLNFKIIYTLMKQYASSNAPDIKIYWTRTTDTFITLANRAAFAKSVGADAFISLHMNSASNSSANGTEVYYSVSNNSKGFGGITSKTMANLFRKKLLADLNTKNRGTKSAGFYVIKHNTVPAILIELGFLSGSSDYGKLTNADFQKKAAKSIYEGIQSMFGTYKTGR